MTVAEAPFRQNAPSWGFALCRTFRRLRRAPRQGIRAEDADQRHAHRGVDDPATAQASSESSVKDQSVGIMMP
jgi:hypothetical protein